MFNRVLRCLTFAKKPLSMTTRRNCRPAIEGQLSACDTLHTSNRRFCTKVDKTSAESEAYESLEENATLEISSEQLEAKLKSNPELEKFYKVLQLETEVMRQSGKLVPKVLMPEHWWKLLNMESRSRRSRYLTFLFKLEKKKENFAMKKAVAKIQREQKKQECDSEEFNEFSYGLFRNTIFMRIYPSAINHFYHSRLMTAKIHGPELIIDVGYDEQMTQRESLECAKQLIYLFSDNRTLRDPFYLSFCNVNKSSLLMKKFYKAIPTAEDYPLDINECSYTKLYDKNKLVYLTPHCHTEMTEYEPDSIYIIGAMVDKSNSQPLSLAKAKKEGLRMAKFPLSKYLIWGNGASKRLPLNQVLKILADIRTTGDWKKAFKHIPTRKVEQARSLVQDNEDYYPPQNPTWVTAELQRKRGYPLEKPPGLAQYNKGYFPPQNPTWVNNEPQKERRYVPRKTKTENWQNTSYTYENRRKKSY
ncbi:mitochondrial ribonuclease P protein 1 homolog [Diprion similis]|uniref:mitochondrial ribonuclease P protein 1 homolog n=1 Tax=Diprion similis TaxID=362088 RepID=UPI001EF80710|nr:mitochondrial ribonuclease P protein 1 homolog [Diprion similis]